MTFAPALNRHAAAVKFHDIADDGKAYSEATVDPDTAAVRLAESFENMRQEFRIDSFSVIRDHNAKLIGVEFR